MLISHCFDYSSLVLSSVIGKCESSKFVLFQHWLFWVSSFSIFILESAYKFLREAAEILIEVELNLFGEYCHLLGLFLLTDIFSWLLIRFSSFFVYILILYQMSNIVIFTLLNWILSNSFKECWTFPGSLVVTCGLVWSFQDLFQAFYNGSGVAFIKGWVRPTSKAWPFGAFYWIQWDFSTLTGENPVRFL